MMVRRVVHVLGNEQGTHILLKRGDIMVSKAVLILGKSTRHLQSIQKGRYGSEQSGACLQQGARHSQAVEKWGKPMMVNRVVHIWQVKKELTFC